MTDEEKKECKCCEELGKFFTLTASIFLGTLLAILVASALLRPNCPCHKAMMQPLPPQVMQYRMHPNFDIARPDGGQFKNLSTSTEVKRFHKKNHNINRAPQMQERPDIQK